MTFVDTNFFLRFLLADVTNQHNEAKEFFLKSADGKFSPFTSVIVFFEVYWVILGQFKKDKEKVIQTLKKILSLKFIEIENSDLLEKAVNIYAGSSLGLVDCYNLVYAKSKNAIDFKTFDKDLIKKLLKEKSS
ncbi:hypothetical protein A2130_00805 [Candidatus Woesebacteria bacterium GWC2_33_12]|uniref:PIN domain-containing protein n=1 Tax=Candidatus Woesebacteria bacterium GW2011_GWB1_33_22 TaxID=1618566 RepID=A0A0F9ZMB2_9BACT|nr:MAG: hypothetical protein UR29_C0002G0054 [Candidatus Woesebacteria bacterium GW2011_GWC2_33_12]KKP42526.1 MAG: hypothetical protein UR33_C0002G0102 [Candidatus Woesebacteria bacterium GW2011_GWA2_33_20]KKP45269.1 MAG: hypothetical protein UR35_C0002G0102 [Candidatus Woesebacteria bacterium GW2011_GWB1_33_22]KKP47097.1 MAG: hypothetical protein UR37_C0002G0009 [Microgenomates group bacterium GW2011_GWC1_33_28]KKP50939.1 MAG: hypothetical protein UR41_C0002G0103 [Candidatus Woesebacteria bact